MRHPVGTHYATDVAQDRNVDYDLRPDTGDRPVYFVLFVLYVKYQNAPAANDADQRRATGTDSGTNRLCHRSRLQLDKFAIMPAIERHEFGVAALLHKSAVFEKDNLVGLGDGGQAVSDDDHQSAFGGFL